ncbi:MULTISPECIES: DUF2577 family protein [Bacillati]|uniref:DUF2577 family protein n=1 Tax=Bacillati TaxID=1783272 RepID=UPI0035F0C9BB
MLICIIRIETLPSTSPKVGEVISVAPLKVKWGEQIVITVDKLVLPKLFTSGYKIPNRYQDPEGRMIDEYLEWKVDLRIGDRLILVPDEYLKTWYVFDVI